MNHVVHKRIRINSYRTGAALPAKGVHISVVGMCAHSRHEFA